MTRKNNYKKQAIFIVLYAITGLIFFEFHTLQPIKIDTLKALQIFILMFIIPLLFRHLMYMMIAPWYRFHNQREARKYENITYNPKVSIIVPAWNEEVGIVKTLISLNKSEYQNFEVIIIDDGSKDKTEKKIYEFLKSIKTQTKKDKFIYYYQQNSGKATGLNKGIKLSTGEIIVTIDADSAVKKDTITNIVKEFKNKETMCVAGNVVVTNTDTIYGVIQYLEYVFGFYIKRADSLMNSVYIVGGAAAAYRKEIFEKIGYFDTKTTTEDIEMSMRIQSHGMKIKYATDAVVVTEGASDLNGLLKQRLRWKRGRLEAFYRYRKLFFRTKNDTNKFLSFLVLPLALYTDIQLFFELFFISALYFYSITTNDYSSLVAGFIIVMTIYATQILFEKKNTKKLRFALLMPIGWLFSYLLSYVEYHALMKSMYGIIRKKDLTWQRWQRKGLN